MEQRQEWEELAELLLEKGYNRQLMRIFLKLNDCQNEKVRLYYRKKDNYDEHILRGKYTNICNRILRIAIDEFDDEKVISKIVLCLFITRKEYAHVVRQIITNFFVLPADHAILEKGVEKDFIHVYEKMRGIRCVKNNNFTNGLLLGLFELAKRSNIRGGGIADFDKMFIQLLAQIIAKNTLPEYTCLPDFEKKLGKEIKAFARPVNNIGERLAKIHWLYQQIEPIITDHKTELNKLSKLLLDQFNYAVLGTISERGRAIAVHHLFQHLITLPNKQSNQDDLKEESDLTTLCKEIEPDLTDFPSLIDLENVKLDPNSLLNQQQEISTHDAATHYDLGIAYKEMGLYEDAIKEFIVAINDSQRANEILLMIGQCLKEMGLIAQALIFFHQALDLQSQDAEKTFFAYELALIYHDKGMNDLAIEMLKKCLEHDTLHQELRKTASALLQKLTT